MKEFEKDLQELLYYFWLMGHASSGSDITHKNPRDAFQECYSKLRETMKKHNIDLGNLN